MDEKFLQQWAVKLGVSNEELKQRFDKARQELKSIFPNQSDEIIFEKAKLQLKVDYKRRMMSNATSFVGVVIASDSPRDPLEKMRAKQIERYEKAKEMTEKDGNQAHINQVLTSQAVRIDEVSGNVIPLWPKVKSDGQPNKLAGKDMPKPEESMIRTVYGIATPADKQEGKGFVLELRGSACNVALHEGKTVNFRAINKSQDNNSIYSLSTNQAEFIPTKNDFLDNQIQQHGMTKIIELSFPKNIVSWDQITQWAAAKKQKPSVNPVPEHIRNSLVVLQDNVVIYQNFVPNKNGKIRMTVSNGKSIDNLDDATITCLADTNISNSIDFAHGSKVMILGRLWIPNPDEETKEVNPVMMMSGAFAYNKWKIPQVDAKKLGDHNLNSTQTQIQTGATIVKSEDTPEQNIQL